MRGTSGVAYTACNLKLPEVRQYVLVKYWARTYKPGKPQIPYTVYMTRDLEC